MFGWVIVLKQLHLLVYYLFVAYKPFSSLSVNNTVQNSLGSFKDYEYIWTDSGKGLCFILCYDKVVRSFNPLFSKGNSSLLFNGFHPMVTQ
jgi:hypothetical protein